MFRGRVVRAHYTGECRIHCQGILFRWCLAYEDIFRELGKLAVLSSYTIWNARQEPAWAPKTSPSSDRDCSHCRSICCFPWVSPRAPVFCSIPMDIIINWFVIFCLFCIALHQCGQHLWCLDYGLLYFLYFAFSFRKINVFNKGWYNTNDILFFKKC